MDDSGRQENKRNGMDYYKIPPLQWNVIPQYQSKEQNAFDMGAKINMLYYERDVAFEERDRALLEKKLALEERDVAVQQRDSAFAERDNALKERHNAIAALQFQESTMDALSRSRSLKRMNIITEAVPLTTILSEDVTSHQVRKKKVKKNVMTKFPKNGKKLGEDLNRHVTTDGSKAEWDAQDFGSMDQIHFDETTMHVPVCSCTGVPHQCYKWGSGGWQSSCCTTSLSVYPLPQMANKRRARMGGRKMSGSVFSRLLTRLAAAGHDLSIPVDLKNYWAKHGTNRYVTIK